LIEPRIIEDLSGGKEECVVGDVSGVGQRGSRGKGEEEKGDREGETGNRHDQGKEIVFLRDTYVR